MPAADLLHADIGIAAPGADVNILAASLTPNHQGSWFRVTIAPAVATRVDVVVSDGATTKVLSALDGSALSAPGTSADANALTFYHPAPLHKTGDASVKYSYNYRIRTNGAIAFLHVDEVAGRLVG